MSTRPLRYSPDGRFLVSCHKAARQGTDDNIVINVWNAHTGKLLKNIDGSNCSAIAFTPDGRELLKADSDAGTVLAYNTGTWEREWGVTSKHFHPISMAISPNGKLVATGGHWYGPIKTIFDMNEQLRIEIIDLANHKIVRTIAPAFPNPAPEQGTPVALSHIQALAWNPNGKYLAAGIWSPPWRGADAVRIFNVHTGKKVLGQHGPWGTEITRLAYTPDGRYLIESEIARSARFLGHKQIRHYIEIWNSGHSRLMAKISGEADSLTVSADGKYVAMGGTGILGGGKVIVWKLR